ncbi:NADH dehydrogenase [bacterium HR35]|nr:NADH dehydrogenase [bacterium HR35]
MKKQIVILGGGFGGVYTLKYLHKFFHKRGLRQTERGLTQTSIKLVLVNRKNYFIFTPLLHEVVTGGVSIDNALEPIREIIKCCDFDFIHGEVEKINLENKIVYINKEKENYKVNYDYLVIALGSKTNYYNIPGAKEYTFSLKTIDDAIRLKNHFVHMFELASISQSEAAINKYLTFVIVGGGATGVELAGEMSDLFYKTFSKFYPPALISQVKIILVEKGKELIPQFSPKLRQKALERLKKLKVDVRLERGVVEVGEDFIKLDDGNIIETKTVIWAAGVEPNLPEIIGNVEKDSRGRLVLNEYLQVKNYNDVFAIGDVCCFIQDQKPLPQLAQVAVRQAKTVALNIKNSIENKPLEKFIYKHTGDLISVGRFYALGEIKGIEFSGLISWFIWKGVYLTKMISFRDQVKTFIDWFLNLFLPRDITEL